MIIDHVRNIDRYKINENFEEFKSFLDSDNLFSAEIEEYFKVFKKEYYTNEFDLKNFETHQLHLDIHLIKSGAEMIGINHVKNLNPVSEYNSEGDFQLFQGDIKDQISLHESEFIILFPNEAHVCGKTVSSFRYVNKLVYKIPFAQHP